MKAIFKMGLGVSAGAVAGKIIFGLSRDYCGNGILAGVGTAMLAITVAGYTYTTVYTLLTNVIDTVNKEIEEESKNG